MSHRQTTSPTLAPMVVPLLEGFALVGVKRSTGYRLLDSDPTFPRPVQLSPGRKGLIVAELEAWVAARAAAREVA